VRQQPTGAGPFDQYFTERIHRENQRIRQGKSGAVEERLMPQTQVEVEIMIQGDRYWRHVRARQATFRGKRMLKR
jgi:hypothetical protein